MFGADNPKFPEYGFGGHNFWRKLHNPVQRAFRTVALARGKHPYALLIDDIQKDTASHRYESYIEVFPDVDVAAAPGGGHLLTDGRKENRVAGALFIQALEPADATVAAEDYEVPGYFGKPEKHRRIVVRVNAVAPNFKVLFAAVRANEKPPAIRLDAKVGTGSIEWPDQQDELIFTPAKEGFTQLAVKRADQKLFGGFADVKILPSAVPDAKNANPPNAAALKLWLSAESIEGKAGEPVTLWKDRSPTALELGGGKGPTLVKDAINGRPALRFNGKNAFLRAGCKPGQVGGDFTLWAVWATPMKQADGTHGGVNNRIISAASEKGADFSAGFTINTGRNDVIPPQLTVRSMQRVPDITEFVLGGMSDGKGGVAGFRATVDIAEIIIAANPVSPELNMRISNYLAERYAIK